MKPSRLPMIAASLFVFGWGRLAAAQPTSNDDAPPPLPPADYSAPSFGQTQPMLEPVDEPDEDPFPRQPPPTFTFKVDGGLFYRNLYSLDITAAELELTLGKRIGRGRVNSIFGSIQAALGSTGGGLSTRHYGVGVVWERAFDRFRIGAGINICVLDVDRVTENSSIWTAGFSPRVHGSVDLLQFKRDHALYFQLRGALDVYVLNAELNNNAPVAPGMTFALGYRY